MIAQGMKLKAIASNWQHHIDILKHCVRRRFVNQRNLVEHLFAFPMDAKFPHVFDADSLKFRFVMEKFFLFYSIFFFLYISVSPQDLCVHGSPNILTLVTLDKIVLLVFLLNPVPPSISPSSLSKLCVVYLCHVSLLPVP